MIGLGQNEALLSDAVRKLREEWERTGEQWNDKARDDFDTDYLKPLDPAVRGALQALGEIRRLLEQAIRDCS